MSSVHYPHDAHDGVHPVDDATPDNGVAQDSCGDACCIACNRSALHSGESFRVLALASTHPILSSENDRPQRRIRSAGATATPPLLSRLPSAIVACRGL